VNLWSRNSFNCKSFKSKFEFGMSDHCLGGVDVFKSKLVGCSNMVFERHSKWCDYFDFRKCKKWWVRYYHRVPVTINTHAPSIHIDVKLVRSWWSWKNCEEVKLTCLNSAYELKLDELSNCMTVNTTGCRVSIW